MHLFARVPELKRAFLRHLALQKQEMHLRYRGHQNLLTPFKLYLNSSQLYIVLLGTTGIYYMFLSEENTIAPLLLSLSG